MNILTQIKSLIKKGKQSLEVDDTKDQQEAQIEFLGQTQTVKQITPYGFYSNSPVDSQWVIFNLRANPNDKVGFGNDYANRPKNLKEGEVVLYNIKTEKQIKLDENGDILITAKNIDGEVEEDITISFDKAELTGDVEVTGDVQVTGDLDVTSTTINLTGNTSVNIGSTGTINITGGTVVLGPATTVDGRVFLNHTHPAGTPPGNTGPVN